MRQGGTGGYNYCLGIFKLAFNITGSAFKPPLYQVRGADPAKIFFTFYLSVQIRHKTKQ